MAKKIKMDTEGMDATTTDALFTETSNATEPVPVIEPLASPVRKEAYKHPTKNLLKSKVFAKYRKEFVAALLPEPAYTMAEAQRIVETYFKKNGKEAKR